MFYMESLILAGITRIYLELTPELIFSALELGCTFYIRVRLDVLYGRFDFSRNYLDLLEGKELILCCFRTGMYDIK